VCQVASISVVLGPNGFFIHQGKLQFFPFLSL
jgi:hypothetical protein